MNWKIVNYAALFLGQTSDFKTQMLDGWEYIMQRHNGLYPIKNRYLTKRRRKLHAAIKLLAELEFFEVFQYWQNPKHPLTVWSFENLGYELLPLPLFNFLHPFDDPLETYKILWQLMGDKNVQ